MEIKLREEVEYIKCEKVNYERAIELKEKSDEMIKFLIQKGGLGLAAPQIGINEQMIIWTRKDGNLEVAFNPKYFPDGSPTNTIEGCLSYPEEQYKVKRHKRINFIFEMPKDGKMIKIKRTCQGNEAINIQHEVDHINGITIAIRGEKF